jgi:hypothetical protein
MRIVRVQADGESILARQEFFAAQSVQKGMIFGFWTA